MSVSSDIGTFDFVKVQFLFRDNRIRRLWRRGRVNPLGVVQMYTMNLKMSVYRPQRGTLCSVNQALDAKKVKECQGEEIGVRQKVSENLRSPTLHQWIIIDD